jgi:hypothetical protein
MVGIDLEMVPVIAELWRIDLTTVACCQDVGEATAALRDLAGRRPSPYSDGFIAFHRGYALLKMPLDDTRQLVTRLLRTPFRDRIRQRWQPESWRIHLPIVCPGDTAELTDAALIHFPRRHVNELAHTLTALT